MKSKDAWGVMLWTVGLIFLLKLSDMLYSSSAEWCSASVALFSTLVIISFGIAVIGGSMMLSNKKKGDKR